MGIDGPKKARPLEDAIYGHALPAMAHTAMRIINAVNKRRL